jgi:hypothetical protein
MDDNEGDFLMQLFGGGGGGPTETTGAARDSSLVYIDELASLFESDYHYMKTALAQLNKGESICQWSAHDPERLVSITAPRDLQERLRQLPREVQADNDYYTLCADPPRMVDAIEEARQAKAEDETRPRLHYLWPQHPIMEWLGDRVLTHFGRHRAPLLSSPYLAIDEQAFILMSLIPNRKGQPLLVDWRVATRRINSAGMEEFVLEPFDGFVARAGIRAGKLPNRGPVAEHVMRSLQHALPLAVRAMRVHMVAKQSAFAAELNERLEGTLQDLKRLQDRQIEHLKQSVEKQLETVRHGRFEQRSREIHRVFDEYRKWVQDTLATEPQPWVQVLAGVCHPDAQEARG